MYFTYYTYCTYCITCTYLHIVHTVYTLFTHCTYLYSVHTIPTDPPPLDEVDLEDLLAALSAEELANLVDEMAADPDDKHMPASVRTAYRCHTVIIVIFVNTVIICLTCRCEKDPTGDLNRDSLINCINEIALNTPDAEEKVKILSVIL